MDLLLKQLNELRILLERSWVERYVFFVNNSTEKDIEQCRYAAAAKKEIYASQIDEIEKKIKLLYEHFLGGGDNGE